MKTFRQFLEGSKCDCSKKARELFASGRITKDEFNKRMGYGKYKKKDNSKNLDGPGGMYKNLVKRIGEEADLDEAVYYTKKVYQAKGKPAEWAIIPKGQVKPVRVVATEEEAERLARKMSTKDK